MKTINQFLNKQMNCIKYIFISETSFASTVISKGKRQLITTILSLFSVITFAVTTNTMTAGTKWETGTWSQSHVPLLTEDVVINSGLTLTINSAAVCASLTLGNSTNSNSSVTINGSSYSLHIYDDVSINPSGKSKTYTLAAGAGTLTIDGLVTINATGTNSITCSTGNVSFTSVSGITWSTGKLSLTNNGSLSSTGLFSQSGGTISNTGTAGSFNFNGGYTKSAGTFTSITGQIININGNLAVSGIALTFIAGSTVILNGSAAKQIIGGSVSTSFYNLTLNNTFGTSPQIELAGNTIVQNQLTMTKGNVNLATFSLTLGTAPATPGTLLHAGVAANGWMYGGSLIRYFNTPIVADRNVGGLFPMGSSIDFRPFYVSHPAIVLAAGGTITISHTSAITASNVSFVDGANTVIRRNDSYWTSSTTGFAGVAGTPFNLSVEGTGFGLVTNVSDLRLTLVGGIVGTDGAHVGTLTDPQINRTGISLLNIANKFYPASVSHGSPLPIELISFDAVCNGDNVSINWATASETNNDFFTIFKSTDSFNWVELSSISGADNSNKILSYSVTDNDYSGSNAYYMLKQTDYDGNSTYFKISSVNCNNSSLTNVTIYPNPFTTRITVAINEDSANYRLMIYNALGEAMISTIITDQLTNIDTKNLPSGIYSYNVFKNEKNIQSGKLIAHQ